MRLSFSPIRAALVLLTSLLVFSACRYYKPITAKAPTPADKSNVLQTSINNRKYFVLREASGNYAMQDLRVDQAAQKLYFKTSALPEEHSLYANSQSDNYRFVPRKGESGVLKEVHVFVDGNLAIEAEGLSSVSLDSIQRIDVIEFNSGRTTASYVLGITIPVAATIGIIAAIASSTSEPPPPSSGTTSSCPFVGVYDGERYVMQGELFGGAIYPALEREDYMPIKATPVNGEFRVRISNELPEVQHTNFAKLLVVRHDKGVKVLTDENGNVYTVAAPLAPVKALLNNLQDITALLLAPDKAVCSFSDTSAKDASNAVVAIFDKPSVAKEAKLVLRVKSSFWLDQLYDNFTQAFGGYYNRWVKQQKKLSTATLEKRSLAQQFPLTVSVKTSKGWKEIRHLKNIGPLAYREVLVPLNLKDVQGTKLEVRLSTGFRFWELDYMSVDYSAQDDVTVQRLDPVAATDENNANVLPALLVKDTSYLHQPKPGNAAVLKFTYEQNPAPEKTTTVILHTGGYYEHVRRYKGLPQLAFLKQFKQPGAFAAFSRQQYIAQQANNALALKR